MRALALALAAALSLPAVAQDSGGASDGKVYAVQPQDPAPAKGCYMTEKTCIDLVGKLEDAQYKAKENAAAASDAQVKNAAWVTVVVAVAAAALAGGAAAGWAARSLQHK